VHGDGRVKVRLGRSHRHRHRDQLNHFGRLMRKEMLADDSLRRAVDDQLHDSAIWRARNCRLQRPEIGLVNVNLPEPFARFLLGQSDGSDLGHAEHRARDRVARTSRPSPTTSLL
jgi:hypothetical protein